MGATHRHWGSWRFPMVWRGPIPQGHSSMGEYVTWPTCWELCRLLVRNYHWSLYDCNSRCFQLQAGGKRCFPTLLLFVPHAGTRPCSQQSLLKAWRNQLLWYSKLLHPKFSRLKHKERGFESEFSQRNKAMWQAVNRKKTYFERLSNTVIKPGKGNSHIRVGTQENRYCSLIQAHRSQDQGIQVQVWLQIWRLKTRSAGAYA